MGSTGKITHVEINIRTTNRKLGKLWLESKTIGWIPTRSRKPPIKKTWEEFDAWIRHH